MSPTTNKSANLRGAFEDNKEHPETDTITDTGKETLDRNAMQALDTLLLSM